MYVDVDDDLTDDERDRVFFEREEALRQRIGNALGSEVEVGPKADPEEEAYCPARRQRRRTAGPCQRGPCCTAYEEE